MDAFVGLTNHFLRESKHELALIDEEDPNESMHWRVFSDKLAQWVSHVIREGESTHAIL